MDHDSYYLKYLHAMFGNASVSFFGVIICIVTLILICIVVMLNSTTVFFEPIINKKGVELPIKQPIIV